MGAAARVVKVPDVRKHNVHIAVRYTEPAKEFAEILIGRSAWEDPAATSDVIGSVDGEAIEQQIRLRLRPGERPDFAPAMVAFRLLK